MEPAANAPQFQEGIRCFNRRAFFEAHEVWEDLWRNEQGPARRFYQGLIQLAVCLHHFRNGNTRGAKKLCLSGSAYLESYRPAYLGLDLDRLLKDLQACCRELLASQEPIPKAKLDADLLPTIVAVGMPKPVTDVSPHINGLNSPEVVERRQAAEHLSRDPDVAAAVSLVRACGDADEQVREWAVAALEQMGAPNAADAVALMELLAAAQGDVRYWSATLLGRLGDQAAAAVGPLSRAIDADADAAVRQRAAWALGRMGRAAVPARETLARATHGGDARLARLAEEALQNLGSA